MLEIKSKSKWGEKDSKPKQWQWFLADIFLIPASLLTFIGSFLMKIGNIMMFDTHHLEIKITPKE